MHRQRQPPGHLGDTGFAGHLLQVPARGRSPVHENQGSFVICPPAREPRSEHSACSHTRAWEHRPALPAPVTTGWAWLLTDSEGGVPAQRA